MAEKSIKVYPNVSTLADQCISLDNTIRKQALSHLIHDISSAQEIDSLVDIIKEKLQSVPQRKVTTRKEQVINSTIEGDVITTFLQLNNLKANCFALNNVIANYNQSLNTFSTPVYLNEIPVNTLTSSQLLMSQKSITSIDLLEIITASDFNYRKKKVAETGAVFSHLLIQKYRNEKKIEEDEARKTIIHLIENDYYDRAEKTKQDLLDVILDTCKNVKYEFKLVNQQ